MAQAILESGSGNSRLAKQANNLFGIKCHQDWRGEYIYADDDAPGECFRKYKSTQDSFKDHTDFLKKYPRYKSLFSLPDNNYIAWAHGLKKAGYATAPNYGFALIDLIRKFDLQDLDKSVSNRKLLLYIGIPVGIILLALSITIFIYLKNKKKWDK